MQQGADPRTEATEATGNSGAMGIGTSEFPTIEPCAHQGRSAITLALDIRMRLQRTEQLEKVYAVQIQNANILLTLFAGYQVADDNKIPRALPIQEAVVETWERIMLDEAHSDMRLQVTDIEGVTVLGQVRTHSIVLRNVSPVLRAALELPMMESRPPKIINVPGATVEAVQELLNVVYTGCYKSEKPSVSSLLIMLDVAHRWSVDHVVVILEGALTKLVSLNDLEALTEAAELKGLSSLREACAEFVRTSLEVKERISSPNGSGFGLIADRALRRALVDSGPDPKRRKRVPV